MEPITWPWWGWALAIAAGISTIAAALPPLRSLFVQARESIVWFIRLRRNWLELIEMRAEILGDGNGTPSFKAFVARELEPIHTELHELRDAGVRRGEGIRENGRAVADLADKLDMLIDLVRPNAD